MEDVRVRVVYVVRCIAQEVWHSQPFSSHSPCSHERKDDLTVDLRRLKFARDEYVSMIFSITQCPLSELPHAQLVRTLTVHLLFCMDDPIVVIDPNPGLGTHFRRTRRSGYRLTARVSSQGLRPILQYSKKLTVWKMLYSVSISHSLDIFPIPGSSPW